MRRKTPMRVRLPYGLWTCADGREVLFNRAYEPIWERIHNGPATAADPMERVAWVKQEWFYKEPYAPWRNKEARAECEAILAAWGVGVTP
jgi:hypothetical protein